jgi:hypothetical protein
LKKFLFCCPLSATGSGDGIGCNGNGTGTKSILRLSYAGCQAKSGVIQIFWRAIATTTFLLFLVFNVEIAFSALLRCLRI